MKLLSQILQATQIMVAVQSKYFDVKDFSGNPIKNMTEMFVYSLGGNYVQPAQFLKIRLNELVL